MEARDRMISFLSPSCPSRHDRRLSIHALDMLIYNMQVGIRCVRLEGSMSMEARDRMISAFTNEPGVTVFLMSLKAGGVALNLTAASHVMLMDPWCAPVAHVAPFWAARTDCCLHMKRVG